MLLKMNQFFWNMIKRIPYARAVLFVVNTYAWNGHSASLSRFAPIHCYLQRILFKILLVAVISSIVVHFGQKYCLIKNGDLGLLLISTNLFPNILGFGIGAYALLFTFPAGFFEHIETRAQHTKAKIGAHGLNAIMAFPLLVIALLILLSVILQITTVPTKAANILGLTFILYGLMSTIELIAILFVSARKVIRNTRPQITATNPNNGKADTSDEKTS